MTDDVLIQLERELVRVAARRVSSRDPRQYSEMLVALDVALVRVRFHSGREVVIRPLRIDQRRARATGLRFPWRYVGFAYPVGDAIRAVSFQDPGGRTSP